VTESPAPAWRPTLKKRLLITAAILGLWTLAVEARLVYLQVVRHEELAEKARRQQSYVRKVPGKRGEILDRNGQYFALNADYQSITAVPSEIEDPKRAADALCAALACSADDRTRLLKQLDPERDFAWVKRNASADELKRVARLDLKGIGFVTESGRFYPNKELAANVVGHVNIDLDGMSGIESSYNDVIQGEKGLALIHRDAHQTTFRNRIEKAATTGASLELTIDKHMQYVAEREVQQAVKENGARAGMVVIQDPNTGEILALAIYPTFNPNAIRFSPPDWRRNRAIQDVYEPGSTMKLVTASAALELKVVRSEEEIDVSGGQIRLGSSVVRDTHDYGKLSFSEVIVKSSNVGAIKVGLKIGPERLTEYINRFGFGRTLKMRDFPGESRGIVWKAENLKDSALARVSMGYQIGVTPLQMASAVSSIANGGELLQARLVRAIIRNGQRQTLPRVVLNRTVAPEIANEVTTIMERVVTDGTGKQAQIPGYTVAGKTGTAAKLVDGIYSKTEYNASFVGFVPSRKPAYTIVVVIDSPDHRGRNGYYGGSVAAPVFRRIAAELLRNNGVPPTINAPPAVLVRRNTSGAWTRPASAPVMTPVVFPSSADPVFPDFRGLSSREASTALTRLGMTPKVRGSGMVVSQRPPAGTPFESGGVVTLWLSRVPLQNRSEDPPRP
jgi:cell division protein FtsI (penicillin-binding protein 3)